MTYEFGLPRIIFGFLLLFCSLLLNGDVVVGFWGLTIICNNLSRNILFCIWATWKSVYRVVVFTEQKLKFIFCTVFWKYRRALNKLLGGFFYLFQSYLTGQLNWKLLRCFLVLPLVKFHELLIFYGLLNLILKPRDFWHCMFLSRFRM